MLDWSQGDLAAKSGLTTETIKNSERGHTQLRESTAKAIIDAFDMAGVEFTPNSGVRLRNQMIVTLEGDNANRILLDDVYRTLRDAEHKVVYVGGVKEEETIKGVDYQSLIEHLQRLKSAGITEKLLVEEGDTNYVAPIGYYRWVPKNYFENVPIQIYGDKIAFLDWGPPQKIIVITHKKLATALAKLFEFAWDKASLPLSGDI